uniref:calpain-9-like n=1 Tax=Myxine glutinosa TaxID=7769 RepID=UPI00358EAB74
MPFFSVDSLPFLGEVGRFIGGEVIRAATPFFAGQQPQRSFRNSALSRRAPAPLLAASRRPGFEDLRARCAAGATLFEDPDFPADDTSLGKSLRAERLRWKRPHEICRNPRFIVDGATRTDIKQGALGDCWLLAAIASLTLNPKLLHRVVHPGQEFGQGYAGIFHFQFWYFGEWVDVIIDDRLPVRGNELVFVHSADRNEFWSALLEKAYAKLNGTYEALKGGSIAEAMEDFTGGVFETFDLDKPPKDLYHILQNGLQKSSMMGCSIDITDARDSEARTSTGLVKGHAYSITGINTVNLRGQKLQMVRIRNPWGEVEWNGPWSDRSSEWRSLDANERERLHQVMAEDGEFWMSMNDFLRHYSRVEICNLTPDVYREGDSRYWTVTKHEGRWLRGCTAGGCRNHGETFWTNPQFRLRLLEEDNDPDERKPTCSFIVALMQKEMRKQQRNLLTLGYGIYKITHGEDPMPKEFFLYNQSCARSESFVNMRETSFRFRLPPGDYIIVPSTFEPHQEADFLLRVFCEKPNKSHESDDEIGADLDKFPPPEEHTEEYEKFKLVFAKLAGGDREVSARELQYILNKITAKHSELQSEGFSMHACKSMVALMDKDGSGKLGLEEFRFLWERIKGWQAIFRRHDLDKDGMMSSYEMRTALNTAGFRLNNQMYQLLTLRYADEKMNIKFNDYITCLTRLEASFRTFYAMDPENKRFVKMPFTKWLYVTMYA